jgi:Catalytic LigB subunit of aromatic ring-opening dioxygenase
MADIVIGIASSHTPQLSSGVDMWLDHAERDRRNPLLLGKDARYHTYDELLATADPAVEPELDPAVWDEKYRRCQQAIEALTADLAKAHTDIAVVIGDDQRELFRDDGIPAFACFTGSELVDMPPSGEALERMPKGIRAASWAAHSDHAQTHPVQADLGAHLAERLARDDFDLTVLRAQPAGRSLGHAFTFPRYRLGLPPGTPIVPVFVNTYYPPNVPSAARCYQLGRALRRAVQDWETTARVAVIASGGLSHFVVDEELDHRVLSALTAHDAGALGSLTRDQMRSGTSEILNWIVAAGALEHLSTTVLDYVPGYRTPAGTGAGMAFVRWD